MRSGHVLEVFATAEATQRHRDVAEAAGPTPWHVVGSDVVAAICDTVQPQGLVARCRSTRVDLDELLAGDPYLVVICADVRDPGNAGTVIRCADAAGAAGVVFAGESVDPFNPKAVRASVGSHFHVGVAVATTVAEAVEATRDAGLQVLAAEGTAPIDLVEADSSGLLAERTAWLLGNEAWGLPGPVLALADRAVAVPIYGRAESLNLATAAAVCLYASAFAQQR